MPFNRISRESAVPEKGRRGLIIPVRQSGTGHFFADAAFLDEVQFQVANLSIHEVVGLVNEADGDVGDDLRRARSQNSRKVSNVTSWPQPSLRTKRASLECL